jgi:diketogulonate reductase-like aldo/keto reductase
MTGEVPNIALNNGVEMPSIGLGVFQTPPDETRSAVAAALEVGYRHIDTAAAYGNEREVGAAVHASKGGRAAVFLETKIWISDYGYDETLHAFDKSAVKLGVDQIDLLILHQALPSDFGKTLDAYRALETLLENGKVRAIGVSNFMVEHLANLLDAAEVVPAVNQIELHPYFQQPGVQALNAEHGMVTQAWSPIGGITFYRESGHTSTWKTRPSSRSPSLTPRVLRRSCCAGTCRRAARSSRSQPSPTASPRTSTCSTSSSPRTRSRPSAGSIPASAAAPSRTPSP